MNKILKNFFTKTSKNKHTKILIVGGGDAGSTVSKLLLKKPDIFSNDISIIDPSLTYTYQSAQTMVGAGITKPSKIQVPLKNRLPRLNFINKSVIKINPEQNLVETEDSLITYDYLVLATGVSMKLNLTKGLKEALEDPNCPVGSNYILEYAQKMSDLRENFKGGEAVFTIPLSPIKCGGAPQKILYLCAEYWRDVQKLNFNTDFYLGGPVIFPNQYYGKALTNVAKGYNTNLFYQHELVEVKGKEQVAIFKNLKTNEIIEKKFDILHATPLQKTASFLQNSSLVNPNSFVNVNKHSLKHNKYSNIYALGDCADLPTSKTLSAVNEQVHIVAQNLYSDISGSVKRESYNGYTACPVFVGKKKVMLCEFGYAEKTLLDKVVVDEFCKKIDEKNKKQLDEKREIVDEKRKALQIFTKGSYDGSNEFLKEAFEEHGIKVDEKRKQELVNELEAAEKDLQNVVNEVEQMKEDLTKPVDAELLLPTFFIDQRKPRWMFYILKTRIFDKFGLYFGTRTIRHFRNFFNLSFVGLEKKKGNLYYPKDK